MLKELRDSSHIFRSLAFELEFVKHWWWQGEGKKDRKAGYSQGSLPILLSAVTRRDGDWPNDQFTFWPQHALYA